MSTAVEHPAPAAETFDTAAQALDMIGGEEKLDFILDEIERWVERQIPQAQCFIYRPLGQCGLGVMDSLLCPIKGSTYKLSVQFAETGGNPDDYHRIATFAAGLAAMAIRQHKLLARIEAETRHDSLTGLLNRRSFEEGLEAAIRSAQSPASKTYSGKLTVLFLGLDRFKQVNDLYGHAAGDQLLEEVARRLGGQLNEGENAARIGGDEFALVLRGPRDQQESELAGLRTLESLRAPYQICGHTLAITASCGVSLFPDHAPTAPELLIAAGKAMAHVKRHGRNHIALFASANQGLISERLCLEHGLGLALGNDEFELVYQPLVNMEGKLKGVEALLSWNHPLRGRIAPKDFIPVAEETGLIVPIGTWVLREACSQGARWLLSGLANLSVSVNVSAVQFGRADFVDTVAAALDASRFPPERLELEVTESFVMQDVEAASIRMASLRKLGIRIAIDDFGTGYSSLSYLSRLPVDSLKIDQSFVRSIQDPSGSLPVVQSIVRLAHNLNLTVVAEGVETIQELDLLRLVGCDQVQGYLYGSALNELGVEALLRNPGGVIPVSGIS